MNKPVLKIIKIGGHVIDDDLALQEFLHDFSFIQGPKILIHGGGKLANTIGLKLGIEPKMNDGRRITDQETLALVTMVYAGLINKGIVAKLQALENNAIGLSGADANLISAQKRPVSEIDFGFVGDLTPQSIAQERFQNFLEQGLVPVLSAITHNGQGQLLNTNADTIASTIAIGLSAVYKTELIYCFEKQGVLLDIDNPDSVIREINLKDYQQHKENGIIAGGMLPKLENAFSAIQQGVSAVYIGHSSELNQLNQGVFGTKIIA